MGTSNRGRMENCSFSMFQRCILIDAQLSEKTGDNVFLLERISVLI